MLLVPLCGYSQYYTTGSDPSSISWSQIKIRQFNLVFPKEEMILAGRYCGLLNDIGPAVTASMNAGIRKMPVIIHPYTAFSNGTSILAPRRIELYPKQPVSLEINDFASQLIIHEVRHFAQMEKLNAGITRAAGFLLGDQAQSLVIGVHVPTWLLEGDAVLTETLLSYAGRGRIASFIQPLRSRLIDGKDLSWDRVLFGSFRETLPNEYLMGYFLTARGRMLTDPMIWSDALEKLGRNPFTLKGLSGITRPKTGYRFSKLYVETLKWLRAYWTDPSLAVKTPDNLIVMTRDTVASMNYYRPQQVSGQDIICLKKSLADLPEFVIVDSLAKERTVARPGSVEDAGFSYYQGKLAWTELIQDPRWENRSFSELFTHDLHTGKKTRLTHGKRYFSPAICPDDGRIAVIEERYDGSCYLHIIDPSSGEVVRSMPEARNNHFSYICWGNGQDELFAMTTGLEGRKLVRIDFKKMVQEVILDAGFTDITCPAYHEGLIYFTGPAGATQGLYRINPKTLLTEVVFAHPHGINYLNAQGQDLFLSVYSSNGYRPAKIPFASLAGKSTDHIYPLIEPVTEIIQRARGEFPVVYQNNIQPAGNKPYRKMGHLFRFHSWSPLFIDPDFYKISPGVVLMSQNDLSTLITWGGYQYNKTDRSHNLLASARYTGLYPTFDLDYVRKYRNSYPFTDTAGELSEKSLHAYWQLVRFTSGVPLDFSSGAWNRKIQPSLFAERVFDLSGTTDFSSSAWIAGINLSASILRRTSNLDLFPKWGVSVNFSRFKAFTLGEWGNNTTGRIMLYLPGFLPNSSFRILNSANLLSFDHYSLSLKDFPRGQVVYRARDRYNLKLDYAFPVSYPDYHISGLIYLKRIKADIFFDAGTRLKDINWFYSSGLDLTFDYYVLRSGIKLESGIRMMYFPNARETGVEFLFSFSVN